MLPEMTAAASGFGNKFRVAALFSVAYECFMQTTNPEPAQPRPAGNQATGKVKRTGRLRWWIPAAIVALAFANIVRLRLSSDLDSMIKNMRIFLTFVICVPVLAIWWLFLTKLRWRTRLIGFAAALLC